jgi:hypothetical protein
MEFVRWDPFQELTPMSVRPNRTVNPSYSNRTEDSFGPWAVDILGRQDHEIETAKPKTVKIQFA